MIYAALLRGINVGGNNKINMKQLKTSFEQAGMTQVVTYIQSGNIIFASEISSIRELEQQLEQIISLDFELTIPVLIRSLDEMEIVMQALPEHWTNDSTMKSDVLFLWEEMNLPSVIEQLPLQPGMGTALYTPGAVLLSVPRENTTRSGMNKLASSKLYKYMTVRNVNTVRQIYILMRATAEQDLQ